MVFSGWGTSPFVFGGVLRIECVGRIIATENTFFSPQKVAVWQGNPLISQKSRFVKYYNLAKSIE